MSLITDLLSKVTQTKPRKDVPPGLTNSINTYKKKETNRKRAIFFSVIVIASLVSGFATIYVVKLLLGANAAQVRTGHIVAAPAPAPTPETPAAAVAPETRAPATHTATAKDAGPARLRAPEPRNSPAEGRASPAPATQKSAAKPSGEAESPDAMRHYYMALDFEKEGNYIKAVDEYAAALAIEPHNFRLMNKVGGLYMRMMMWEEAAGYLEGSVGENGRYVPALINRGIVYAEMDRFEAAESSLKEALSIEPASRLALFNIALLYEKRSMPKEAKEHYMKLKQLGDPQGAAGVERLETASPAAGGD